MIDMNTRCGLFSGAPLMPTLIKNHRRSTSGEINLQVAPSLQGGQLLLKRFQARLLVLELVMIVGRPCVVNLGSQLPDSIPNQMPNQGHLFFAKFQFHGETPGLSGRLRRAYRPLPGAADSRIREATPVI
ncbi:MAG: hypothetical protein DCC65_04955 [Planctomycetota bacterium]|nr:MAG: hypothetical protein DCC65_04955 [Planctomycetota bacterium]